jgi:hypothetical protein
MKSYFEKWIGTHLQTIFSLAFLAAIRDIPAMHSIHSSAISFTSTFAILNASRFIQTHL